MKEDFEINLNSIWSKYLKDVFDECYIGKLKAFLKKEKSLGKVIYPKEDEIFEALNLVGFDKVKVVILGQDPYHGDGQAHGLAFSVKKGVKIPPSLVNIYKEIAQEFNKSLPPSGDLSFWAEQGVLLLNSTLTVENGKAGSHKGQGWEEFTDAIIKAVNDNHEEHVVFMLWGAYAQKKGLFIDSKKHLVLKASHPSPLSAYRGFIGCGHFKKANKYLSKHGKKPIDWVSSF